MKSRMLKRLLRVVVACTLVCSISWNSANFFETASLLPVVKASSDENVPTDIKGHWSEQFVKDAITAGYVKGYDDGTFRPNSLVTGQEFLTMLVLALDLPVKEQNKGESWFSPIYQAAKQAGIYADEYADPSKPIMRSEMTTTIVHATNDQSYQNMYKSLQSEAYSLERIKGTYTQWQADIDYLSSDSSITFDPADLSQPEFNLTALRNWYTSLTEQFEEENKSKGKVFCSASPLVEQWYIDEYDCVHEKDKIVYPVFDRYNSFLLQLINAPKDISARLDRYFDRIEPRQDFFEAVRRGIIMGTGNGDIAPAERTTRAQAVVVIQRILSYNAGHLLPVDKQALQKADVYWHHTNLFSVWPNYLGIHNAQQFDTSKLRFDSNAYKGSITGLYIIDADDPKNPYWNKIKYPLKELYRDSWSGGLFPLANLKDAYIIVYEQTSNEIIDQKHPINLQLSIRGVGEGNINDGQMTDERVAQMKRAAEGSFEVMQTVARKTDPSQPSHQRSLSMFVIPKYNIKVNDYLIIDLATGVSGDRVSNRVMIFRPNGTLNRLPEPGHRKFYPIEELN